MNADDEGLLQVLTAGEPKTNKEAIAKLFITLFTFTTFKIKSDPLEIPTYLNRNIIMVLRIYIDVMNIMI